MMYSGFDNLQRQTYWTTINKKNCMMGLIDFAMFGYISKTFIFKESVELCNDN